MAMSGLLTRLAAQAPVPVHVVQGLQAADAVSVLRASTGVRLVGSPRHATVLVVAGRLPRSSIDALHQVHDQVPAPRAVAAIGVAGSVDSLGLGAVTTLAVDHPGDGLRRLHESVLRGTTDSPAVGRAGNPVEWQGVGPNGQGGEGMMGGTPYGRPMVMPPVEGRDGLALDRLALRLGPFLPGLPPGYVLDVGLQGDVLEEAAVAALDLGDGVVGTPLAHRLPPVTRRASRCLHAIAELCVLAGLDALSRQVSRVAIAPDADGIKAIGRALDARWGLRVTTDAVGVLDDGGDVTSRWQAWLDQAAAAMDTTPGTRDPEQATERVAAAQSIDLADLGTQLVGMQLSQALLTLASLRVELEDRRLRDLAEPAR